VETQVALNEGYHAAFIAGAVLSLITTLIGAYGLGDLKVPAPPAYECDAPAPEAHAPSAM
jgi:hypothetical protein